MNDNRGALHRASSGAGGAAARVVPAHNIHHHGMRHHQAHRPEPTPAAAVAFAALLIATLRFVGGLHDLAVAVEVERLGVGRFAVEQDALFLGHEGDGGRGLLEEDGQGEVFGIAGRKGGGQ